MEPPDAASRRQPLPGPDRGRLATLARAYAFLAVTAVSAFALFCLLNAGWALFERARLRLRESVHSLLVPPNPEQARLDLEVLARVYPGMSLEDIRDLQRENEQISFGYSAFAQYRELPAEGRFVNIAQEGFRRGGAATPWPPSRDCLNIFMFGGSTTFGYGVPDADTVPSALQSILARMAPEARARAYNFGRCGYYSGQEKIVFIKRLAEGFAPDIAVFLDGINEFETEIRDDRLPYSDVLARAFLGEYDSSVFLLRQLSLRPPLVRSLRETLEKAAVGSGAVRATWREEAVVRFYFDRYLRHCRMSSAIGREFGAKTLFIWQPAPSYRYDLNFHLFGRDLASEGALFRAPGYAAAAARRRELESLREHLWLADMQEHLKKPLYVDHIHYTAWMNRLVAQRIAEHLRARGWLKRPPRARARS